MIEIREETVGDVAAIRDVNRRAFGQDQEGNIVDALRSNNAALLSLVATVDDRSLLCSSAILSPGSGSLLR